MLRKEASAPRTARPNPKPRVGLVQAQAEERPEARLQDRRVSRCRQTAEFRQARKSVLQRRIPGFSDADIARDAVRRIMMLFGREQAGGLIARFAEPLIQASGRQELPQP